MKNLWISVLVLCFVGGGKAQIVIQEPLDVRQGLQEGTVQATVSPAFTNDSIAEVFDGNPFTEAAVLDTNRLTITLAFQESQAVGGSRIFMWNSGVWSLEAAMTASDLDQQQGSYVRLVDQRSHPAFQWDSLSFPTTQGRYFRLSLMNPGSNGIYIGEWVLQSHLVLTGLYIYPHPPKVLPNTHLQLKVKIVDELGYLHPYNLSEPVVWSVADLNIARIGEFGLLEGVALGQTTVTARTSSGSLSGQAPVHVLNDFQSPAAQTRVVKVALVLQDPVIDSVNNRRIHEVWNWSDPNDLVAQLLEEFTSVSHGVVDFQIVEVHDDAHIFTTLDGEPMSIDTLAYYFDPSNHMLYGRDKPGTLQNLAEVQGRVHFDYKAMCDQYNFGPKRNNGIIDEVWVYSFPFSGMYESQLMGPNAFWWNSPPITDYAPLEKLLSVMGWNYERGVAEAMHSFGHRVESALVHAYGRWDTQNDNPNSWELFTRIDKDVPGGAHVGNIHFPPNGQSDYDYGNTRTVVSYADNWKRYPYLLDQTRTLNCEEWRCDHLQYMRWWFSHLPHFQGVYEGVLNNWWLYAVDYETAVELASQEQLVGISTPEPQGSLPQFRLFPSYPNPFNASTTITYQLPQKAPVTVRLYDVSGRLVREVSPGVQPPGIHNLRLDATSLASGVYFFELQAGPYRQARKMVIVK